ncbi:hypothetical protein CPB84DRAFT_1776743, partial [Gymnopilus junonius]
VTGCSTVAKVEADMLRWIYAFFGWVYAVDLSESELAGAVGLVLGTVWCSIEDVGAQGGKSMEGNGAGGGFSSWTVVRASRCSTSLLPDGLGGKLGSRELSGELSGTMLSAVVWSEGGSVNPAVLRGLSLGATAGNSRGDKVDRVCVTTAIRSKQ